MDKLTVSKVFSSTSNICLKINSDKVNATYDDGVTPFDLIDHAVKSHDMLIARVDNQASMVSAFDLAIRQIAEAANVGACAGVDTGEPVSHTAQMIINSMIGQQAKTKLLRDSLAAMVKMVDEDLIGDFDTDHASKIFSQAEAILDKTL